MAWVKEFEQKQREYHLHHPLRGLELENCVLTGVFDEACKRGDLEVVRSMFLQHPDAQKHHQMFAGYALYIAVDTDNLNLLNVLLQDSASKFDLDSAFYHAAEQGRLDMVKCLIQAGECDAEGAFSESTFVVQCYLLKHTPCMVFPGQVTFDKMCLWLEQGVSHSKFKDCLAARKGFKTLDQLHQQRIAKLNIVLSCFPNDLIVLVETFLDLSHHEKKMKPETKTATKESSILLPKNKMDMIVERRRRMMSSIDDQDIKRALRSSFAIYYDYYRNIRPTPVADLPWGDDNGLF